MHSIELESDMHLSANRRRNHELHNAWLNRFTKYRSMHECNQKMYSTTQSRSDTNSGPNG